MNCKKCGTRLDDVWKCCPTCGEEVKRDDICPKCGYKLMAGWKACPYCGNKLGESEGEANTAEGGENAEAPKTENNNADGATYGWNNSQSQSGSGSSYFYGPNMPFYAPAPVPHKMKWYKFLANFFIWFTAVVNLISAVSSLISLFSWQTQVDLGFITVLHTPAYLIYSAVVSAAFGAYGIRVGILLRKKSKKSLSALVAFFAATPVLMLIEGICFPMLLNLLTDLPGTLLGNGLIIWANIVYFKKRSDVFVN